MQPETQPEPASGGATAAGRPGGEETRPLTVAERAAASASARVASQATGTEAGQKTPVTAPVDAPAAQDPDTADETRGLPTRTVSSFAGWSGGIGRITSAAGRLGRLGASRTYRLARRASSADGAGETGLFRLVEIHFLSIMGDTLVALALAGSVFLAVPDDGGGSRKQVALFLLLTMLPFIVVAPLIAPVLDRYRQWRRWELGGTLAARAVLCVVLAGSLGALSPTQFLATLGVLIASKAYNLSRIAAIPRLLPDRLTLVKANGRMSLAGVLGATAAAPAAVALGAVEPRWILYLGCVVLLAATALAVLLPGRADTRGDDEEEPRRLLRRPRVAVPARVVTGLRVNAGLRALSGFLLVFMAFAMIQRPFPGWEDDPTLLLSLVVASVGVGNAGGTALAALVRSRAPQAVMVLMLLLDAAMAVVAALNYGFAATLGIATVAGAAQQLGKLSLDSLVQKSVPEDAATTMFAKAETVLQVAFVIGAFIGLVPVPGDVGMWVAAVLLVLWTVLVLALRRGNTPLAPALPVPAPVKVSLKAYKLVRGRRRPEDDWPVIDDTKPQPPLDEPAPPAPAPAPAPAPPEPVRHASRPTPPSPYRYDPERPRWEDRTTWPEVDPDDERF